MQTRVFTGVTADVLNRLAHGSDKKSDNSYVLDLEPGGFAGRLTRRTGLGEVVIRFDHNPERSELTVTILKKPVFLPTVALWAEMSYALENASQSASGKT